MTTPSNRFATKGDLKSVAQSAAARYATQDVATTSAAGLMSASDKEKLDGMEDGAEANVIEAVTLGGRSLSVSSGTVNVPVDTGLSTGSQNPVENRVVSNAILGLTARLGKDAPVLEDWSTLGTEVGNGNGPSVAPVGTQIRTDWTVTNGSTVYEAYWNVVHHPESQVEVEGGATKSVAYMQMDKCLPFNTEFSPQQAFLYAIDGLPAGTYNVTMGFSWGSKVVSGKTYQFTLESALPAGGQLAGFYRAPDADPSTWCVYAFASRTATSSTETVTVSEGSDGTSLGTFTAAGAQVVPASGTPDSSSSVTIGGTTYAYYGLNSLHRVAYGDNRWLHSPLRQYLNGTGSDWWTPSTVFDRPPSYASHRGFLSGLPAEFVAQMQYVRTVTALNYVTDGGSSGSPEYDVTYDRVFLPSGLEHYLQANASFGGAAGLEGEAWRYWKRIGGAVSPLPWSGGNYSNYHPEYIQYDLADHDAARNVWVRSANRGNGYYVAIVDSVGYCGSNSAVYGRRVAAACAIGKS